jgi:hypothetical protein
LKLNVEGVAPSPTIKTAAKKLAAFLFSLFCVTNLTKCLSKGMKTCFPNAGDI